MKERSIRLSKNCIGFLVLLAASALLLAITYAFKLQPSGGDVWGHLYKSEVMYENIMKGNWYPLYDMKWYNGIQLYRYWPPFSYYLMSGMMVITGGNLVNAYMMLGGVCMFLGGVPWVIFGNIEEKRVMGTSLSILWFFMPEISRNYYCNGNLPQILTTVLVPYIVLFLYMYVRKEWKAAAFLLYFGMMIFTVSHLMVTAIMGVAAFVFLMIDGWFNKNYGKRLEALVIMVCGILTAGIWFLPALKGGMIGTTDGGESIMSMLIIPLTTSLNPFIRLFNTNDNYYFGLSVFLLSITGILLMREKKHAGFIFAVVVLALTTPATFYIISKLPFSGLFWMTRFSPMAYGFFFMSMLEWKQLKKKYSLLFMAILLLDLVPSILFTNYQVTAPMDTISDIAYLRKETSQRTSIMDLSSYGPYPSYGLPAQGGVDYTFGWAWQGAVTGDNIVLLNEALEKENYLFLFDRSIELGADTVLVRRNYVGKTGKREDQMISEAEMSGYHLIKETASAYIFKKETPKNFGVKSVYPGIVIGKYAPAMTTMYPCFLAGEKERLDEYSFDELKDYEVIFITGMDYKDKKKAEDLVVALQDAGVRIVIDAAHMKENSMTKQPEFLGVVAQQIHFTRRYPVLDYKNRVINTRAFNEEDKEFITAYIAKLDEAPGTFSYGDETLTFYGYNDEYPNITYLGINLLYHAGNANDREVTEFLNEVLGVSDTELPRRELVPMEITMSGNDLIIRTDKEDVNTTLAFQDNFVSDNEIDSENHLLVVKDKETVIHMVYPLFVPGIIVSVLGIISFGVCLIYVYRRKKA